MVNIGDFATSPEAEEKGKWFCYMQRPLRLKIAHASNSRMEAAQRKRVNLQLKGFRRYKKEEEKKRRRDAELRAQKKEYAEFVLLDIEGADDIEAYTPAIGEALFEDKRNRVLWNFVFATANNDDRFEDSEDETWDALEQEEGFEPDQNGAPVSKKKAAAKRRAAGVEEDPVKNLQGT